MFFFFTVDSKAAVVLFLGERKSVFDTHLPFIVMTTIYYIKLKFLGVLKNFYHIIKILMEATKAKLL